MPERGGGVPAALLPAVIRTARGRRHPPHRRIRARASQEAERFRLKDVGQVPSGQVETLAKTLSWSGVLG